ncbi:MAG: MerR family transcriptional regulator [Alphaproteobacteria bacterium]
MAQAVQPAGRRGGKSAAAFRTISEVAAELDVPQHVLRFWESKFTQVRPLKRGGGRRYYRPEDVELLRHIRKLLYDDGYTIKGVQKLLRGGAPKAEAETGRAEKPVEAAELPLAETLSEATGEVEPGGLSPSQRNELEALLRELSDLKRQLDKARS